MNFELTDILLAGILLVLLIKERYFYMLWEWNRFAKFRKFWKRDIKRFISRVRTRWQ